MSVDILVGAIKVRHEPVNYLTGLIAPPPLPPALQLPGRAGGHRGSNVLTEGKWKLGAESKQTSEHCGAVKNSCGFY